MKNGTGGKAYHKTGETSCAAATMNCTTHRPKEGQMGGTALAIENPGVQEIETTRKKLSHLIRTGFI